MRILTLAAIMSVFFALQGCGPETHPPMPKEVKITDNADYNVSRLFTVDDCSVYSFTEYYTKHYFVTCKSQSSGQTISPEICGKGCVRDEQIITSHKPVKI